MNALYLILIVLGITAQHVTKKRYSQKNGGGTYSFAAISALAAMLVFFVISGGSLHFQASLLLYALGFAITYGCSILFTYLAITEGPLSITSLITSYSLLIPAVYGLIAWGEKFDLYFLIGIVLLAVSIFLIRMAPGKTEESGGEQKKQFTAKWLICVLLAFVGSGGCTVVQREQQIAFEGGYKNEFMILALVFVLISMLVCGLVFEKKQMPQNLKNSAPMAAIGGLANGGVNYLVMILSARMDASQMFPIISAGGILMASILSMTVYKEKLSTLQKIGLLLGIASIVVLNL